MGLISHTWCLVTYCLTGWDKPWSPQSVCDLCVRCQSMRYPYCWQWMLSHWFVYSLSSLSRLRALEAKIYCEMELRKTGDRTQMYPSVCGHCCCCCTRVSASHKITSSLCLWIAWYFSRLEREMFVFGLCRLWGDSLRHEMAASLFRRWENLQDKFCAIPKRKSHILA